MRKDGLRFKGRKLSHTPHFVLLYNYMLGWTELIESGPLNVFTV